MKITHLLLSLLSLFLFISCGDDDSFNPIDGDLIHYDGPTSNSPALDPGDHELAVYFPASVLSDQAGKQLVEVEFFAGAGPQACKLLIHGTGTSSSPGSVIYEKDLTAQVQDSPRWIIHKLDSPIDITATDDLWIGVMVNHIDTRQTIGCDAGPRNDNGDWIWQSANNTWQSFRQLTGTESVNWNIRGVLE